MKTTKTLLTTLILLSLSLVSFAQTTWTGATSTQWTNTQNWTNGIPASTIDAIISATTSGNYPEITSSASVKNLEIGTGTSLILGTGSQLEINGDFVNHGDFEPMGHTTVFAGTTHLSDNIMFDDLIINGTLICNSNVISMFGNLENNGTFVNNGGTIEFDGNTMLFGTSVTTFNNIAIYGTLTGHGHNFNVEGNFMNNGTFYANQGTILFNGHLNQSIGNYGTGNFWNLTIDNTSMGVCLVSDITADGSLKLNNGYVDLYTYTFTIGNSAPNAISRTNGYFVSETIPAVGYSFLKWNVGSKTGVYEFPFSTLDGLHYIPVTVEVTTPGVGNGAIAVATYNTNEENDPYPNGVANMNDSTGNAQWEKAVNRYWMTTVSGFINSPVSAITFNAAPEEIGANQNLTTQKWNGINWVNASASQIAYPTGAKANDLNDYSVFILTDNYTQPAAGTDTTQEVNGIRESEGSKNKFAISPNIIGTNSQNVRIQNYNSPTGTLYIIDASGKQVFSMANGVWNQSGTDISLGGTSLASGLYFVSILDGKEMQTQKLIVQ